MPFSSFFQSIIPLNINPLNSKVMNNKKKNEGQTDFSYYGLYLLDYLRTKCSSNHIFTFIIILDSSKS